MLETIKKAFKGQTVEELRQKYIHFSSFQNLRDQRESLLTLQKMFRREDKEVKRDGKR